MTLRSPPAPPPRVFEFLAFDFGVFVSVGMFIYLVDAASRGMITWSEVRYLQTAVIVGCLPMFAISRVLRWWRLKKEGELCEYERTLAKLADPNEGS